jgi:hypothetical protein
MLVFKVILKKKTYKTTFSLVNKNIFKIKPDLKNVFDHHHQINVPDQVTFYIIISLLGTRG